jgi:hypothetical protein
MAISSYSHSKCYLRFTNDCSSDITKEHYISDSLLKLLEQGNTVKISGLRWIEKETFKLISRKSLTAHILCAKHNNGLYDLDTEMVYFFKAAKQIEEALKNQKTRGYLEFSLDGHKIERWLINVDDNQSCEIGPHLLGRHVQGWICLSRQLIKQRLGLLEVGSVKAFSEPAVDRYEQFVGFIPLALLLPQPAEAHRRPQLPGFGLLAAGNGEGLLKAGFGLHTIPLRGPLQEQLSLQPIQLRREPALPSWGSAKIRAKFHLMTSNILI